VAQYRVELSEPAKLEIAEAQDLDRCGFTNAAERWIERFYDCWMG
jgi:hypothetical protein